MNVSSPNNKSKSQAFWRPLLDFVFPPECVSCQQGLSSAHEWMWCDDCLKQLCNDPKKCCPACGAEKTPPVFPDGRCRLCRDIKLKFERAICIGNYHSLMQKLVVKLKRNFDESLALQFGLLLGNRLLAEPNLPGFDLILPAPIHWWTRLRRPSYLPAIIAEGVAKRCNISLEMDVLRCLWKTRKQGTLDTPSRFKNVQGAFAVRRPHLIAEKTILVIDDVITSGATANQLAAVLRQAGAKRVLIAAIARGVRQT